MERAPKNRARSRSPPRNRPRRCCSISADQKRPYKNRPALVGAGRDEYQENQNTTQMNQYHKLYTPEDSAIVFIDHQPQMLFGVANMDRSTLINNVTLLAT